MNEVVKKLKLVNSALDDVNSNHRNLEVYRDNYNKLFDSITDNEDSSTDLLKTIYTCRDYILELESLTSSLTSLVVEFGLGNAQANSEFVNNLILNNNNN